MTIADTTTTNRSREEFKPQLDQKGWKSFVRIKNFQASSETYAIYVVGDCLAPIIKDGDYVVCEPGMDFGAGDFVVFWPKNPAKIPAVKRLVIAPPRDWQKWTHPDSEAVPACIVEMLNPQRRFCVDFDRIAAIHRVVSWGDAVEVVERERASHREGGAS